MNINQFDFDLPESLIAQYPPLNRGESRLLVAPATNKIIDTQFSNLVDYFNANDVLVINNTKVIKARLLGKKASGGKIEVLIERVLNDQEAICQIKASKSPKIASKLIFNENISAEIINKSASFFHLYFDAPQSIWQILEQIGKIPLPPYITRDIGDNDSLRYQTIYAKEQGAVAAPTAGLHFTEAIMQQLNNKGVIITDITLHVGAGTFQPVRVTELSQHKMHREWFSIPENTCNIINQAHASHHQVCAIGTTTLRALESAAQSGQLKAMSAETDIFITPGYSFKVANKLFTNFHLPRSTLLMLVSAFAGYDKIKTIYQHAIEQQYRFFSYGDCMLLDKSR